MKKYFLLDCLQSMILITLFSNFIYKEMQEAFIQIEKDCQEIWAFVNFNLTLYLFEIIYDVFAYKYIRNSNDSLNGY